MRWMLRSLMAVLLLTAVISLGGAKCSLAKKKAGQAVSGGNRMFVVTTDHTSGAYSTINVANRAVTPNIQTVNSDAVARVYGGFVWVVNRSGQSNITKIDPNNGYQVVSQWTVKDPPGTTDSNPQDIEFVSLTKAYVTRYALNTVLIINPTTGAQLGTIDLSSMVNPDPGTEPADPDGVIEMSGSCLHNGTLYVAIQRLDFTSTYAPVGKSYIVTIDTATDTMTGSIALDYANPFSDLLYIPSLDRLAVACINNYGVNDGAIQLIDPNSNVLDGTALLETAINGDVNDFVIENATKGYVLYNDSSYNLKVRAFNPSTGVPAGSDVVAVSGFNLSGLALMPAGDQLFVGDRTGANPGVRVYNTATDIEITAAPINTGLPPIDIHYVP